jgi:hypothetical protein
MSQDALAEAFPLGAKADSYASAKARKASYSSAKANISFGGIFPAHF